MWTKRISVSHAFSARLQLGALLLLTLGSVAQGQYLTSPCPSIFNYRRDPNTDQVFGHVELQGLRIGQMVKLNVDLSIGVAVPENNVGSITLVKSNEQTFRDIYNSQPAQYRVNFPLSNVVPNLLEIRVNGNPICYGQKANGQIVTTINLDHTLVTQLQTLSNPSVSNPNTIQLEPVQQTPRPFVYTEPQQQIVNPKFPPVQPTPESQSDVLCGIPPPVHNTLSINGHTSIKGQFPWAVPIFDNRTPSKPEYVCGSTILNKYHLVTAGHCMHDGFQPRLASGLLTTPGMYNISNFNERQIQRRYVEAIIVHPNYYTDDNAQTEYDIALMVLKERIMYGDVVRPICLWNGNDKVEDIVGMTGFVSGWGVTEYGKAQKPSYVIAKVLQNNQCRRKLRQVFSPEKGMFCADGLGGVPCAGDSGSGLVLKQDSRFYLRGIVSIGQLDPYTLLCDTTKYVVYTDVAAFRTWLQNEMYS